MRLNVNIINNLCAILEGYTSPRLQALVSTLDEPDFQWYLELDWFNPKTHMQQVVTTLFNNKQSTKIKNLIIFALENKPTASRMNSIIYEELKTSLINKMSQVGLIYQDGVIRYDVPDFIESSRILSYIDQGFLHPALVNVKSFFDAFVTNYQTDAPNSLGNLRNVYENLIKEILTQNNITIVRRMKDNIEHLVSLDILPQLIDESRNHYSRDHFYGIYSALSNWGSHGAASNELVDYIVVTTLSAIKLIFERM